MRSFYRFGACVGLLFAGAALAQVPVAPLPPPIPVLEPPPIFRYAEGQAGAGRLRYQGKTPILVVEGTAAEVGRQLGSLQMGVVADYEKLLERYVKFRGWEKAYPWFLKMGGLLEARFPASHREEFAGAADAVKVNRDLLVLINTAFDVVPVFGCSTIVAEPKRSASGEMLFGRNLDLPPFANLHELACVTIYRTQGKRPFASVGYPGVFGVISGMNDAGLALAVNEIYASKDASAKFNPLGTPKLMLLRRCLEECATLDEAEQLLKDATRTGMMAVTICDAKSAAVLEVTAKNVVRRAPQEGLCFCTNHFRTDALGMGERCFRWDRLELAQRAEKLDQDAVGKHLHAAAFRDLTMQTMIFEPTRLRLHLAFGRIPSSALPRETIDLGPLLRK